MSDAVGRWIPGLDPLAGTFTLPAWSAGALAALFAVLVALAFSRAGRDGMAGGVARMALVLLGAALAWFALEATARHDFGAERRALETRASLLAAGALRPGSPLACLDAIAGDTVEGSCERALFATPEAMAAAVSYVAAQLALFADVHAFARRHQTDMEAVLAPLRRALEADRYGLVAHVLATRDGCTAERCETAALLQDARRVAANLSQRTYEFYVARHAQVWPQPAPGPTAEAARPATTSAPAAASAAAAPTVSPLTAFAPRPPGPGVFFPSADSIPPVHIMTAEPQSEAETTGSAPPRTPLPPRRPAQSKGPAQ